VTEPHLKSESYQPRDDSDRQGAPPPSDESNYGASTKSNGADEPPPKLAPIRFVEGEAIPCREWTVPGWIPKRKVTLIQGDGGDGKTSLMQQLQSSCATGLPWLGLAVKECPSIGFYTEDEERDLKIRQAAIDAAYGLSCANDGKMSLFSRTDQDNELIVFSASGKPELTRFYRQVVEAAMDFCAGLVTLDVAVDLFGGDEIKRRQVRAFMALLNALARTIDGAVVLSSHVSQSAIRTQGGHSGSTDWSNAARSRLYLCRPKDEDGVGLNARILTRKKAQFASAGDAINLHWKDDVIIPDSPPETNWLRRSIEDVFLALLGLFVAQGRDVSPNPSVTYAPAVFEKHPNAEGFTKKAFAREMERLLETKRICVETIGPPSRQYKRLTITPQDDAP
jgi:hypothetical protein